MCLHQDVTHALTVVSYAVAQASDICMHEPPTGVSGQTAGYTCLCCVEHAGYRQECDARPAAVMECMVVAIPQAQK